MNTSELNVCGHYERASAAFQSTIEALTRIDNLDEFAPQVLSIVARTFGACSCALYEHPAEIIYLRYWFLDGKVLNPSEIMDLDPVKFALIRRLAGGFTVPDGYLHEKTHRRKKADIVDHEKGTLVPEFDQFALSLGWGLELNVPVVVGEDTIAAICIYRDENVAYTPEEIHLAETLSSQLALAIQATRLSRLASERAAELAISGERERAAQLRVDQLIKTNETLKLSLDVLSRDSNVNMERALGHVLRVISEQIEAPSAALWTQLPGTEIYQVKLVYHGGEILGTESENFPASGWPSRSDLRFRDHIEKRRPVVYEVAKIAPLGSESRNYFDALGVKTLLGVPLILGLKVIGCFTVRFTTVRYFSPEDLELVQSLALQAALAMELIRLGEEAKQVAVAREKEQAAQIRSAIAREIHDNLAQSFTAILLQLEAAEMLRERGDSRADRHFRRIKEMARLGLSEARRSSLALSPAILEEEGLLPALAQLAQRAHVEERLICVFGHSGLPKRLPPEVEATLFGVAQEGLNNAIRHGLATEINLQLFFDVPTVTLQVSDNGTGLSRERAIDRGMGLRQMEERLQQFGGVLRLQNQTGGGALLEARIPGIFHALERPKILTKRDTQSEGSMSV